MSGPMPPVEVAGLEHAFGDRQVLCGLDFQVAPGEVFGLLGPNGSGKTTLFRILATLIHPAAGTARVAGLDVVGEAAQVRTRLGIVFQSPALDDQLTVAENLLHHGRLHGLRGAALRLRVKDLLGTMGLADRAADRAGKLSGGLRRRADLARGLLHRPEILLLDEPTSGLDPLARRDFWTELLRQQQQHGLTVLFTTHLMEEGESCGRVAILDAGRLVALDTPESLRQQVGGTVVTVRAGEPEAVCKAISERFQLACSVVAGAVRIEHEDGAALVPRLASAFPGSFSSMTVQSPTLEDVFISRTGHAFSGSNGATAEAGR